jgi:phosphomannomutase
MKILKYLIIYRTTKDPMMAAKIYQMIYHPEIKHSTIIVQEPTLQYSESKPSVTKPTDKKTELMKSLEYLKSKKSPTKQDKDSIYTIEMVLKNMK